MLSLTWEAAFEILSNKMAARDSAALKSSLFVFFKKSPRLHLIADAAKASRRGRRRIATATKAEPNGRDVASLFAARTRRLALAAVGDFKTRSRVKKKKTLQ